MSVWGIGGGGIRAGGSGIGIVGLGLVLALGGCAGGGASAGGASQGTVSASSRDVVVTVADMQRDLEPRLAETFGPADLVCGMGDLFAPGTAAGVLQEGNALTCSYLSEEEKIWVEVLVLMVEGDRYVYEVLRGFGDGVQAAGVPSGSDRDPEWLYRDGLACADLTRPVTAETAPGPDFADISERPQGDADSGGLSYAEVVAYWFDQGQPAAMDPDGDGRPCAEVFTATEISDVFDQSVPVQGQNRSHTPTVGPVTTFDIRNDIAAQGLPVHEGRTATQVDCSLVGPVGVGSVITCAPRMNMEADNSLVVVIGSDGGYLRGPTAEEQRTDPTTSTPWLYRAGLGCADLRAPVTEATAADLGRPLAEILEDFPAYRDLGLDYFGAVAYFHLHGHSTVLDPDGSGWPCEGEYPQAEVDQVRQEVRVPGQE